MNIFLTNAIAACDHFANKFEQFQRTKNGACALDKRRCLKKDQFSSQ